MYWGKSLSKGTDLPLEHFLCRSLAILKIHRLRKPVRFKHAIQNINLKYFKRLSWFIFFYILLQWSDTALNLILMFWNSRSICQHYFSVFTVCTPYVLEIRCLEIWGICKYKKAYLIASFFKKKIVVSNWEQLLSISVTKQEREIMCYSKLVEGKRLCLSVCQFKGSKSQAEAILLLGQAHMVWPLTMQMGVWM